MITVSPANSGSVFDYIQPFLSDLIGKKAEEIEPALGFFVRKNGVPIAGVLFHFFNGIDAKVSLAAEDSAWASRRVLRALTSLAFVALGAQRITAYVTPDKVRLQKLMEHMGFVKEGTLRKALDGGGNLDIFGLLKEDARWLHLNQ